MNAGRTIQVLIADDHAIVRHGLRQIMGATQDVIVCGEARSAADAFLILRSTPCQVLVLDISLPDRNGIEVLKQVKKEFPRIAVLMLSMHREDEYAIRALRAGASGYLNKQSAPTELVRAIRNVASGRKHISPAVAEELANHVGGNREAPLHESLSDREYQTFIMIASGKSVSQIAAELSLSVKTISVFRARTLEKMKLKNNSELTHYAIKNGLVD